MVRLRYVEDGGIKALPRCVCAGRLCRYRRRRAGRLGLCRSQPQSGHLLSQHGQRDEGNLPLFAPYGSIDTPFASIEHLILQDITGNGAVDLVVNGHLIANLAATGAPFRSGPPQDLGSGPHIAFLDLDGDGRLELIGLAGRASAYPPPDQPHALHWRCLTSTNPIQYGPPQALPDVPDAADCTQLAASQEPRPGLLLQCNTYQHLVFYELTGPANWQDAALSNPHRPGLLERSGLALRGGLGQ